MTLKQRRPFDIIEERSRNNFNWSKSITMKSKQSKLNGTNIGGDSVGNVKDEQTKAIAEVKNGVSGA